MSFRTLVRDLLPGYLRDDAKGERVAYSVAVLFDMLVEWTRQGLVARFPGEAPPDGLQHIGADRRIVRGFDESTESYRLRLKAWRQQWRLAGHARGILDAIAGYLTGHDVIVRIFTDSAAMYQRDAAGVFSHRYDVDWDWDGTDEWWRYWVYIYAPPSLGWAPGTYGDGSTFGDDGALTRSSAITRAQKRTIDLLIREWGPRHGKCEWIIVSSDSDFLDPDSGDPGLPDGTWANWGKRATPTSPTEPARDARGMYWRPENYV